MCFSMEMDLIAGTAITAIGVGALRVVSALQARARLVVVDTPPLRADTVSLLGLADRVLLVTRPDLAGLKNTPVAGQLLADAAVPTSSISVVINRRRTDPFPDTRDIEHATRLPVEATVAGVDEAAVLTDDPADARTYRELAERILD